jgi:uncharacterized protein (DUF433 family)
MTTKVKYSEKVRIQVDLTTAEATLLQHLAGRLSVRSRADLLQQAYGTFLWIIDEMLSGQHIISVDAENLKSVNKFKELSLPAVEPLRFDHYDYLIARPETGRNQLYLKGRNMTVGQLIYKMRANQLSDEEAAKDMDLPLTQIKEAQVYYQTHRDLIESEAEEEKQELLSKGVKLEPGHIPG